MDLFGLKEKDAREEKVKNFKVRKVDRRMISNFIEKWHYSKNMNGVRDEYCFGLYSEDDILIGAALFAQPATPGVAEAYNEQGTLKLTELRRLCCIDDTPRNTESYFIGQMLKWLKRNTTVDVVLSYADKTHGHEGIIYQATNFRLIGQSPAIDKIMHNGKLYHDKSLRTMYNGRKKPFCLELQKALDEGKAQWVKTKPKNIYLMRLYRRKHNEGTKRHLGAGAVGCSPAKI